MAEGDLIVSIGDKTIESVDDLHRFLGEWPIAQPTTLTVIHGLDRLALRVVPTEAP